MEQKDSNEKCGNVQLPDPKTVSAADLADDMWSLFHDTTKSHLDELEAAAMALETGNDVEENASLIRRILHSIKGNAGVIGLTDISDVFHQVESELEEMANPVDSVDMLLKTNDWMESVLEHLSGSDVSEGADQQVEQAGEKEEKSKLKALIIDDDPVCRKRLESLLGDFFDCSFAVNGRLGLEAYIESVGQKNAYDFLTLDINMPELNGHETLEAIRKWETENGLDGSNVKIIMTTSENASKHIMSSFRQGCEAYVIKTALAEKLLDEVAKLGLLKVAKVETSYTVN